jgi:flagellar biosynthetic protein FliP
MNRLELTRASPGTAAAGRGGGVLQPGARSRSALRLLARLFLTGLACAFIALFPAVAQTNGAAAAGGVGIGAGATNAPAAVFGTAAGAAASNGAPALIPFRLNFGVEAANRPEDLDVSIRILLAITLLTLAPSMILLMTSFTRIAIVLSFVRTALSLQGTPANQIIIGLSLFITFFVMAPTWEAIHRDALAPYQASQISSVQALENASGHIRTFMLKQARPKDVELFVSMARMGPTRPDQLPLKVVIPGFVMSELRTAFQMGFLLFVPFILIDLVVATVLMSLGMMMMPPVTISLPLKILLFVLVDGWELVVRSLVQSFNF